MTRGEGSGRFPARAPRLLQVATVLVVASLVLGVAQTMERRPPQAGMTVGASVVSASDTTIVLTLTGPMEPGKASGSTITTRPGGQTEFALAFSSRPVHWPYRSSGRRH